MHTLASICDHCFRNIDHLAVYKHGPLQASGFHHRIGASKTDSGELQLHGKAALLEILKCLSAGNHKHRNEIYNIIHRHYRYLHLRPDKRFIRSKMYKGHLLRRANLKTKSFFFFNFRHNRLIGHGTERFLMAASSLLARHEKSSLSCYFVQNASCQCVH